MWWRGAWSAGQEAISFSSFLLLLLLFSARAARFPREFAVPDQCYAVLAEGFGECTIRGHGTDSRTPFLPTHHHIEVSSSAWRELQINTTLSDQVHADVAPDMPVTGGAVSFFYFGLANKTAHCQLSIRLHLHWLQQDLQAQWRPIGALPAGGFRPYLITCYVQNCSRKSAD